MNLVQLHLSQTSFLQRSLGQVVLKVRILERHIRVSEIRILQRRPRRVRQAIVRDQRLLASDCAREAELVIDRPHAVVPDQRACAAEIGARRGAEVAVGRGGDAEKGGGRGFPREPDDDAFPVVPVAETG